MARPSSLTITGLVLVVVLAGCASAPAGGDGRPATTTTASAETTSTPASSPRTTLAHTTYLVVGKASESRAMDAPEDRRIAFENLTDARQEEFLTALESVEDVADPQGWGYGDWAYVEYEGGWYDVHVVVV